MVVQVAAGRKPFSANLTLVRFFAAVDSPVCVEAAGRREALVADQAYVWLLPYNPQIISFIRCFVYMKQSVLIVIIYMKYVEY